jgi:hypothetical protein
LTLLVLFFHPRPIEQACPTKTLTVSPGLIAPTLAPNAENRTAGVDNLRSQPLDGSPGKQITQFPAEHILDFHWSPDGSQLGLIRGHTDSDVVLIRDMQP